MSLIAKEWLIVSIYFLTFVGVMFLEAFLINRKGWTRFGKSLAFSAVTNLIGFAIGGLVPVIVFGVALAMAWDGVLGKFQYRDYALGAALILAILFFPLFLTLCKRLFLRIFEIQTGRAAWFFALASSLAIVVIVHGLPTFAGYLMYKFL